MSQELLKSPAEEFLTPGAPQIDRAERAKDRIAALFLACAVTANLSLVIAFVRQPLLDQHNFRQTQTALTTWWLVHGAGASHWLNYQTPLFGSPWQIPFEFPLFQWLVASVHWATAWPLDALGRGLSALLFYATLWPLAMLARDFGFTRRAFLLMAGLLLLSPVYVYWSRAFLMESMALFLSMSYLASVRRFLTDQRTGWLVVMNLAAVLGILVKVTTFAGFAAASMLLVTADLYRNRQLGPARWARTYLPIFTSLLLAGGCLELWVRHIEHTAALSYFGYILAPSKLLPWNYGTLAQRLSATLWKQTIWRRAVPEALGSPWVLMLGIPLLLSRSTNRRILVLILVFLFLLPFLTFTNLHIVHNYYQYANAVFLVLGLAVAISHLSERIPVWCFVLVCFLAAFAQFHTFRKVYWPSISTDFSQDPALRATALVRTLTPPDSVVLIVGAEWSSVLPYYAQRRALCIPRWATPQQLEAILQNPAFLTEGRPVSAILNCIGGFDPANRPAWTNFVADLARHSKVAQYGPYEILLPRSTHWEDNYTGSRLFQQNTNITSAKLGLKIPPPTPQPTNN
jgi:hypothetical protein